MVNTFRVVNPSECVSDLIWDVVGEREVVRRCAQEIRGARGAGSWCTRMEESGDEGHGFVRRWYGEARILTATLQSATDYLSTATSPKTVSNSKNQPAPDRSVELTGAHLLL
jgi:hypothetical protein